MVELPASSVSGPVTVFYPSTSAARTEGRGPFSLEVALDGVPAQGNGKLVVISHGSPASPWVYFDLARALVEAGFVVAMPEHFADNYKDDREPGPPSWRRRPLEVGKAIDRLGQEPRFAARLDLSNVGMYGMSAGGHTALTLAGGRWSPSRLRQHCRDHIREDFHGCAGLATSLSGGIFDGLKIALVQLVIGWKLDDAAWYSHTDGRIRAIVAGVPLASDFDPASLENPKLPLGIITARQDKWLPPRFHGDAILAACKSCQHLGDFPTGGHGALLSPPPPSRSSLVETLVGDPPGFDRGIEVPRMNRAIVEFFRKHLGSARI